MKTSVGIMHGRLLPPFEGRFQAFPADGWRDEFAAARDAGLDCIEWIYEQPHEDRNPMASADGRQLIRDAIRETGVEVRSICADYFMTERLIDDAGQAAPDTVRKLIWLLEQAADLEITYIVLPFVDASSLTSDGERDRLVELMRELAPTARGRGVELHLETDLPPDVFHDVMRRIGDTSVRVNFDIGNSASLGYAPQDELSNLGPFLGSVHIKDRVLGGATVPLGTGNADFPTCFRKFREHGFDRWFILQAARGEDGRETELARDNRRFVEDHVARAA
jgi:hexulose-6-phosphate isomerase